MQLSLGGRDASYQFSGRLETENAFSGDLSRSLAPERVRFTRTPSD